MLGRNSMPETDVYSTCCAVQNLWLAARSEGVGAGWVSILKLPQLRGILGIPPHIIPVAYLCLGYPLEFTDEPGLQRAGWRERLPVEDLLHFDDWNGSAGDGDWKGLRRRCEPRRTDRHQGGDICSGGGSRSARGMPFSTATLASQLS